MSQHTESPTREQALARAAHLLRWAEGETDLAKMERLTDLGEVWVHYALVAGEVQSEH